MIDRQYGNIIVVCDSCGEGFMAGKVDFYEAISDFKENGGIVTKRGKEWLHHCGDPCTPSEARAQAIRANYRDMHGERK